MIRQKILEMKAKFLQRLSKLFRSERKLQMFSLETLPEKGVYTLIVFLPSVLELEVGKLGTHKIPKGYYAYTGSAVGTGSSCLKNRISRHLLKEKRKFWHIDFLLANKNATIVSIVVSHADRKIECIINNYIKENCKAKIPILGFGASDCRENCKSHLLYLGKAASEAKIAKIYAQKLQTAPIVIRLKR